MTNSPAISLLSRIQKVKSQAPVITIFGGPGVGKTTFAASAEAPVFIRTEDGLIDEKVDAFPIAASYEEVIESIGALYSEAHQFKTVVLDSVDWLEALIWNRVCRDHQTNSIEALGYGKGYVEALAYWRQVLGGLTALRNDRGMTPVLICHSEVKHIEDPQFPAYDAHGLKLHKRAAAVVEEASDIILFATMQTGVSTEDAGFGNKRTRAVSSGQRIIHTAPQAAFLAKSRYPLPPLLPLDWSAFASALENSRNTSDK